MKMERIVRGLRGVLAVAAVAGMVMVEPMSWAQAAGAAATAPTAAAHAPGDIAGDWQGTLQTPQAALRIVVRITKGDKGWAAKMYSIDQNPMPINASSVTLDGSAFKYVVDLIGGSFEGRLSADGDSIVGNWKQGGGPTPTPLTLVRASKTTAWEIPAPPPPPKLMAADADPSFDVATIKPNDTGATQMQGLNVNGRNFTTRASSLADLISFSYDVQMKQIVGGADWMNNDRYDIAGVPDKDGVPSPLQLKVMIRKLLAERFKLTFHHEKRELAAYVLTVAKDGPKLTPTQLNGPLPGLGFRPGPDGLMLGVRNGTMTDFTGFLQILVLDRPVVDQTGLTGKYDFQFKFTPDDSQFNGHPPHLPEQTEAAPDLFKAIQVLGLKLDAEKTPVDVIVIDHVEKPSAN